ncbi:antitoxin [soil metagenome]
MRTTVTLDPDVEALLRMRMRDDEISFKQAVNDAIRAGMRPPGRRKPFRTKTSNLGTPTVNLDKATQLAGELEDEEIIRKMRLGK